MRLADTNDWLQPDQAKAISDVLLAVWRNAEANDDDATVAKARSALNHLGLPWFPLADSNGDWSRRGLGVVGPLVPVGDRKGSVTPAPGGVRLADSNGDKRC